MAEEKWDYLGEKWEDIAQPVSCYLNLNKKTLLCCEKVQGSRCNDTHNYFMFILHRNSCHTFILLYTTYDNFF